MNFQITRVRLAAVGPDPARFDPLELDLRKPDQTGPADSVLFLPNTGGKTVLMRLLFSVLHPPIVERIGTEEAAQRSKNLVAYVLERDTAHVAIEWRRVEDGRFSDDEALVTGLVAEWRSGRPTGKPEDLARVWYSVRGPVELAGVDQLVFDVDVASSTEPVRRRLPLRRFREQLEELKKGAGRAKLEVSTTEVQRDWMDHLDRLGLDRALFRYQGQMNHNEAGASAIAQFKEDRDFIKFFLDAVFDPAELASLDREFEEVADKVRRFPEYERRVRFEKAALGELEPLVGLVAALAAAREEAIRARASALALLAAFSAAREIARSREERERERSRQQDAEARRLTAEVDRLRDQWREFRRLGATFWRDEAELAYKAAAARVQAADLDVRAWMLTEDLARLAEATGSVKALDEAYSAEMERLRPLQTARDDAAVRLSRTLSAKVVLAENDASVAKAGTVEARGRAARARKEAQDALVEAAKLDAAREADETRLGEVEALHGRLVTKGLLTADEPTVLARDREAALAAHALARIEVIEGEMADLDRERSLLDEEDRVAAPRMAEVLKLRTQLAADIQRVEDERSRLATEPLVIELAETTPFDLELVGAGIAERLVRRANQADDARLDVELQAADDRRAYRALEETGFLPPPADVEAALARLASSGITGAMPGTRYIAEAISSRYRGAVAANRADLAGGIVLTENEDVARARAVLESASLDPSMIIAIGSAAELAAGEQDGVPRVFVVPPSEAVWDRSSASLEKTRRDGRLAAVEQQRATLQDQAAAARRLAEALVRHCSAHPVGWLSMRIAERDRASGELIRLDEARETRVNRRTQIATMLGVLRTEATELRRKARVAEQRAADLRHLVDEESSVVEHPARIERRRNEAASWRTIAEESERAAQASDEEAERRAEAARDHSFTAERFRDELSGIGLARPVGALSVPEAQGILSEGTDLFQLRASFTEIDRRLAGQTSASGIAVKRDLAIRARDDLTKVIATHPSDVRERAALLLSSPEGGALAGRRAATERANAEVTSARSTEREADLEQNIAGAELASIEDEIRSSRRPGKIPDDRIPPDRHRAMLFAAEALQRAEDTRSQVTAAEAASDAARIEADSAQRLTDGLGVLATQLRMGLKLEEEAEFDTTQPFDGELDEANAIGLETAQRLNKAIDGERSAEQAWRERDNAIRGLLARDDFADLAASDRLHRRLFQSLPETLARDARDLVAELCASIGVLEGDIATLEEDRRLATTSLAKSVQKALGYLRLAEARSKMPARLRDWSGESFLEIRFEKPPAEELDVRLRTFVIEILDPRSDRPTGSKLLMLGLDRAVGQFRVKILKPNESFAPIRVPVAELSSPTFSNGQRATVATALMLMLSELRRQSRSAAREASVGTLVLDNPLGNANAGFLIDVQRTVAAAAGIQLVYTTGIADQNALRRFPNVIALSNDAARRSMRRYVRANPTLLEHLVPADGGSGGRLSASRVVALPDREAGRT